MSFTINLFLKITIKKYFFFKDSCTLFLNKSKFGLNESLRMEIFKQDFKSLLIEWNIQCNSSDFTLLASSSLMIGAMFGSFSLGYLADYYGRKYTVEGTFLKKFY